MREPCVKDWKWRIKQIMWKILHIWRSGRWRFDVDVLSPQVCLGRFLFEGVWSFVLWVNHASLKKGNVVCLFGDASQPAKNSKIAHSSRTQIKQVQQDYKQHFSNLFSLLFFRSCFACGQKIHGIHVPGTQHLGLWHWQLCLKMSFFSHCKFCIVTWVWWKHESVGEKTFRMQV